MIRLSLTQQQIADALDVSRQPISKFFNGKPVDRNVFIDICNKLKLDFEVIIEQEIQATAVKEVAEESIEIEYETNYFCNIIFLQIGLYYICQCILDRLVTEIRERIKTSVRERCGTMRCLDMKHPVELTGERGIYTDVNILEEITGRQRLGIAELIQEWNEDSNVDNNFDHFRLNRIPESRILGLKAVQKHSRVMVLGKPGSGKTTFLKYMAMQCIEGEFEKRRVPIFLTLKDYAEAEGKPSLLDYIVQNLRIYEIELDQINELLKNGRLLILLDGLDEVREEDTKRVLKQIEKFSSQYFFSYDFKHEQSFFLREREKKQQELDKYDLTESKYKNSKIRTKRPKIDNYPNISRYADQGVKFLSKKYPKKIYCNQFVITCRIAAKEYTFQNFTEVEVADFNWKQITVFVQNWFRLTDSAKANRFIQKIRENKPVKELGSSPLLLTLLCLVFGETGDFPVNRSELYKEGLDVLLKKWDATRNIERDQIYKGLSVRRKEDLLSQIALTAFEQKEYFIKQKILEEYITNFIQNLRDVDTDPERLKLDSEAVLKSIEAQHGLLIERAKGIYSFSHLTFQEYFTAREIVANSAYNNLIEHVIEKRWREVVLLTVGMLRHADNFMWLLKWKTDEILALDQKLQEFLFWINQKTALYSDSHKIAIRIAYFLQYQSKTELLSFDTRLISSIDQTIATLVKHATKEFYKINQTLIYFAKIGQNYTVDIPICLELIRICKHIENYIYNNLDIVFNSKQFNGLKKLIFELAEACNNIDKNFTTFQGWFKTDARVWIDQAEKLLTINDIKGHVIGKSWNFTKTQNKHLEQYYDANILLVSCLNSDCYIRREERDKIVATLFIPKEEIQYPDNILNP